MDEDQGKKEEEKLDFTPEGEALVYISLDQARVRAIEHARDNREFYGPLYSQGELVWEVLSQEESEDYYDIRLSFRPAAGFGGQPGVEQFTIDKTGPITLRQILSQPTPTSWGLRVAVSALTIAAIAGASVGIFFAIDNPPPPEESMIVQLSRQVTDATGIRTLELIGIPEGQSVNASVRRLDSDQLSAPPIAEVGQRSVHSYLDISLPGQDGATNVT